MFQESRSTLRHWRASLNIGKRVDIHTVRKFWVSQKSMTVLLSEQTLWACEMLHCDSIAVGVPVPVVGRLVAQASDGPVCVRRKRPSTFYFHCAEIVV